MTRTIWAVAIGVVICAGAANAQTRWVTGYGPYMCPTARIDPSACESLVEGTEVRLRGIVEDNIGRKFQVIEVGGRTGYMPESHLDRLQAEDPKVIAARERARAAKAAEAQKKAAKQAEEKRRKQAEEDEAAMTALPPDTNKNACILTAAERLPRIAGLEILASRAVPLPPEHKRELGTYQTMVEIDAKAAGITATYRFACMKGLRTPAFVIGIRPGS
jgi:hypothetical protein